MAVQPTYPGVYIQEVPSGVRTIAGVATSIAMFVGRTESGIMDRPTRVFNFTEFKEKFGDGTQQSEMAHQVRQFFQNGGNQAYVMRIAEGVSKASVDLNNEAENTVLRATAKEAGRAGERIRIEVDYDTPEPDKTFNMRIFRMVENGAGGFSEEDQEEYPNLTMDSTQARYAPDVVTQGSKLIEFTEPDPVEVESSSGVSVAGRVLGDNPLSDLNTIINTEGWSMLRISLGGDFETVDLSEMGDITSFSDSNEFTNNLNPLLSLGEVTVGFVNIGEGRNLFVIRNNTANDISIEPTEDPENDFSTAMQLGIERGGIEIGAHAFRRPAPSSLFFSYGGTDVSNLEELFGNLGAFATSNQGGLTEITVNGQTISELDLGTTESDDLMLQGRAGPEPDSFSLDNVREKVRELEAQFNDRAVATADFDWELRVQGASPQGLRIVLKPTAGDANVGRGASVGATIIGDAFVTSNTRYYSIGPRGRGNFQDNGNRGNDGSEPELTTYQNAFRIIANQVDLFNLLILSRDRDEGNDEDREDVWGPASVFAQEQRAFLLVDPPKSWRSRDNVTRGIGMMRRGLVKDHAGIFWPRLKIVDPKTGLDVFIDPSGTMAGAAARIDRNRGVWKAFAGIEADLRLVRGVEYSMSDAENGVINQQAVNAVRVFPNGVVSWGARTMDGFKGSPNIDYRYIPVRRLALFIEESLYRGLKWVVFEPNDEALWAEIRKAVGGFMQDLFRQGAFQGTKPKDAYFVKVDSETTTQRDINLGIVNIWVGFAPVRPAEFVIVYLQQMAGQGQS